MLFYFSKSIGLSGEILLYNADNDHPAGTSLCVCLSRGHSLVQMPQFLKACVCVCVCVWQFSGRFLEGQRHRLRLLLYIGELNRVPGEGSGNFSFKKRGSHQTGPQKIKRF